MSWERNIRRVVPYVPGEQPNKPNMVKLNTNENPYSPAPAVEEILKSMDYDRLRLYPDPTVSKLVNAIADWKGISSDKVFVGVGSDDVLAMCFMTFFNSEKPILFPDITYSFYDVWADMLRIPYRCPSLNEDFEIVKEDYLKENGGIVFPNPNAPTGLELPMADVEAIIAGNPDSIVIVDEAYVDFGGESALPLIDKYDNLIVVQTFSKSRALAGIRIGFAMGNPDLIRYLNDVKYSFNSYTMNQAAIEVGTASVLDTEYFEKMLDKVIATRENTKARLAELGFIFPDSKSNFIFASHRWVPAKEIFEALKENNIYVRYFSKPRIDNYLRISIGTDEEMDKLIAFLTEYLAGR